MQKLVYSKLSPLASRGCCPTTPSPVTSSSSPVASVMSQWRDWSFAGRCPSFEIRMV